MINIFKLTKIKFNIFLFKFKICVIFLFCKFTAHLNLILLSRTKFLSYLQVPIFYYIFNVLALLVKKFLSGTNAIRNKRTIVRIYRICPTPPPPPTQIPTISDPDPISPTSDTDHLFIVSKIGYFVPSTKLAMELLYFK